MFDTPHRRRNPLNGQWVLVSPQRLSRPWQGAAAELAERPPSYDPECYLCPGNERVTGAENPNYDNVYLFKNDFAALMEDIEPSENVGPLFSAETTSGECHVICFSPDHSKTLPELSQEQIRDVIDAWCGKSAELGAKYQSVQIFENKGEMMGCSNPHPHCQIWATSHLSDEVKTEDNLQREYFQKHGAPMLLDLVEQEAAQKERVVVETENWLAIVPYWASWPFETMLLPRFPVQHIVDLQEDQKTDLANALARLTARYDNLFQCSFPYSMGWHGAPFGQGDSEHWQLHAHFYPPLLRSATVRKFMVGYEMMAEAQRDLTAEMASGMLRDVSDVHYLQNVG